MSDKKNGFEVNPTREKPERGNTFGSFSSGKSDPEFSIGSKTSLGRFIKSQVRTIDGALLIVLMTTFVVLGLFPSAMSEPTFRYCTFSDVDGLRLAFFVMPLALLAEYFWFSVGKPLGKSNFHVAVILAVTALIPFVKPCLE